MGGGEGGMDLLMYTHAAWVPLLLCSTPDYSLRGNSTSGNALWVPQGVRATRCREEGRGWWRRGGGTYRQPLRSEPWLSSVTGPSGPQADGPASLGNLRRSGPPLSAVCWATLRS